MYKISLFLFLILGLPLAVQSQPLELTKKFETEPGHIIPFMEQENLYNSQRADANGDGKPDLVFFRPDETVYPPLATMRIVVDPRDPSGNMIVLDLQGNQGLGFTDPKTPFLGFFQIWSVLDNNAATDDLSFAFGGPEGGLYLYNSSVVNEAGQLYQTFILHRDTYRLVGIIDLDDDDLVDFVMVNTDARKVEVWGYKP